MIMVVGGGGGGVFACVEKMTCDDYCTMYYWFRSWNREAVDYWMMLCRR
jgi:hypothetical protein